MTNKSVKSNTKIYQYRWLWQESRYTIKIEKMGKGKPSCLLQGITCQKGARFAPSAFVTGCLDHIKNQEEYFNLITPYIKEFFVSNNGLFFLFSENFN